MKLSRKRKLISRACLMAAASLIAAVPTARAANVFFDPNGATTAAATAAGIGTGGTGNWDATLNFWVNAGTATSIPGNVLGAAYTFTNADTAYFIGQSGTATLQLGVTLNGIYDSTQGMTIAGAQTLTLAGSTPTITNTGSAVTTISSNLAGTVGFTKAGTGILALTGTNTISGNINLQQGVLSLGSATALGTSSLTIGGSGYAVGLDGNGASLTSTGAITVGSNFTYVGSNSLNLGAGAVNLGAVGRTIQVGMNAQTTGALTVGGVVSGAASLTKTGSGALTLSGANTYTGGTILNAGSLTLSGANTYTGATTVEAGTLRLTGSTTTGHVARRGGTHEPAASTALGAPTASGGVLDLGALAHGAAQLWPHRHGTDAMFIQLLQRGTA